MILSKKQYEATRDKLAMLESSLTAPPRDGVPGAIADAARAQIRELIEELRAEMVEYEATAQSDPSEVPVNSIEDLLVAPIRYRIASGLSTEAFAREVEVNARQIFRYEQEGYRNASLPVFVGILGALGLRLTGMLARSEDASDLEAGMAANHEEDSAS